MTRRGLWKPVGLVALGAFVASTGLAAAQAPPALGERPAREVPVEGAPSRGPAEAPVVVVEFCDVASEACSAAAVVLEALLEQYGDRVRHVFKHRPDPDQPDRQLAHEAVAAASAQDGFWVMREMVLSNQHALTHEALLGMAAQAGLDPDRLAADLASGEYRAVIERDQADAWPLDIETTPTFFVNGHRVTGVPKRADWIGWIEGLIHRAPR